MPEGDPNKQMMPSAIKHENDQKWSKSKCFNHHFSMFFEVRALHDGYVCQACQVELSAAKTCGPRMITSHQDEMSWIRSCFGLSKPNHHVEFCHRQAHGCELWPENTWRHPSLLPSIRQDLSDQEFWQILALHQILYNSQFICMIMYKSIFPHIQEWYQILTNIVFLQRTVLIAVGNRVVGRFLPPKIVLLWNGAILLLTPCSGRSGLFGAWNGNATAPTTVAPNTAPIKAKDGWKERSCGKAGFVARNNLDCDGDSWFNLFSPTSGVQMALPVVKKVPAEALAESRVVMAEWNLPK